MWRLTPRRWVVLPLQLPLVQAPAALPPYAGCSSTASSSGGQRKAISSTSTDVAAALLELPVVPFKLLTADGRTPYAGVVSNIRDYGAVVELGGGHRGLLPVTQYADVEAFTALRPGSRLTVYIAAKKKESSRMTFTLEPASARQCRVEDLIFDGQRPYEGVIRSVEAYGAFVDMGVERPGFLPVEGCHRRLEVGERVTVYPRVRKAKTGRFEVSLSPSAVPLKSFKMIEADGQTPYQAVVTGFSGELALLDLSSDSYAALPLPPEGTPEREQIQVGAQLTVYLVGKDRSHQRISATLEKREKPVTQLRDLAVDGQTPYEAIVRYVLPSRRGAYLDIGCEEAAFLPHTDPAYAASLEARTQMTVYIMMRHVRTGVLTVSSVKREKPLGKIADIAADGTTPFKGIVQHHTAHGIFVDLGLEAPGLLLPSKHTEEAVGETPDASSPFGVMPKQPLAPGSEITVYVLAKNSFEGRLYLDLQPRKTAAISVWDLPTDGVTPMEGEVVRIRGNHCFVDLGAEQLGVLKMDEAGAKAEGKDLRVGQAIRVYGRRRSPPTGKISLGMEPDAKPRLPYTAILTDGTTYEGRVASVQYGAAFVDFGCDVTAMIEQEDVTQFGLTPESAVTLRPLEFDEARGRWRCKIVSASSPPVQGDRAAGNPEETATSLPEGWEVAIDPVSKAQYYFHRQLGTSQWERPAPQSDLSSKAAPPPPPLPSGWESAIDPDSQRRYYYHRGRQLSQWEFPSE
eukprot:TRINITY_DN100535_c0_g1_i1.p1 TRINITY_DN100535_c0_g1~~TRINITY_DN100535_c0_g1_i1.p1  ORF type:complete len:741 (+),score=165.78 TRINITY_DN100535_c0_g1_i1:86-2308(+)